MPPSTKLQLKVTQKLQLSPQVRHAIGLMQLTRIELIGHIKQVAETNPLVDLDALHADPRETPSESEPAFPNQTPAHINSDPMQWATDTSQHSLAEHLRWQANHSMLSDAEHDLALGIIDHIDERGLLSASVEEVTESLKQTIGNHAIDVHQVEGALKKVQRFDPPGVGALTVEEALRTQLLTHHQSHPHHGLAVHLIDHHFQKLGRGRLETLARLLDVDESCIQSAFELIQTLNPHPGTGFGALDSRHLIPDLYVYPAPSREAQDGWQVSFNHSHIPTLRLNDTYDRLIKNASASDRSYLNNQRKEAITLMGALALRHQTLVRVAMALVSHQSRFLREGPQAMQPLTQATLADELGVHVSTISRTCRGKYAQTPQGLIELKSLFCGQIAHQTQGVISNKAVQEQIRGLIGQEDKQSPLSDQAIAARLGSKGVKIARRTVTKYREKMGIDGSKQRRNMHNWTR